MKNLRNLGLAISLLGLVGCVAGSGPRSSLYGAEKIGAQGVTLSSRDAPAPANPMGVTGTLNMRDAQSLFNSLDSMVGGLSQREQLAFMEAFFRVANFDRCDINPRRSLSPYSNLSRCTTRGRESKWYGDLANAYVAEKRVDTSRAYVASNAFGSWTGGRSQRESYVNFINEYGAFMDGRSADYIFQRNKDIMRGTAVSFRNR